MLRETLTHMFLFEQLSSADVEEIVDTMTKREVALGEVLIRQGTCVCHVMLLPLPR